MSFLWLCLLGWPIIHLKLQRMGIFFPLLFPIDLPAIHEFICLDMHHFKHGMLHYCHTQVLKVGFCHQSYHLMKRGEGLTPRERCSLGWEALVTFVLLFLLRSTWGKFVADGSIHVLFLAFCFSVYGFAFIFQIHVSIHLFSLFCMYDSILTLLFLYKQLLKSCHAVSQTQGRTENSDKQDIAFLLNCACILGALTIHICSWLVKIARVWLKNLTFWCLDFWCTIQTEMPSVLRELFLMAF